MSDLTKEEQDHVRDAIRFLRIRFGTNKRIGQALRCKKDSIQQPSHGKVCRESYDGVQGGAAGMRAVR